ncbi:MAG: hypothetical protein ACR2MQ_07015 [Gemmatimonadaceae bacterium]
MTGTVQPPATSNETSRAHTADIPHPSTDRGHAEGKRIQTPPRGTIKRSITVNRPRDEVIAAWRKTDFPADADFRDAPGDHGTVITVTIPDATPKTALGSAFETLMRKNPSDAVVKALEHFREMTEAGEIPTTDGQPSGKRS